MIEAGAGRRSAAVLAAFAAGACAHAPTFAPIRLPHWESAAPLSSPVSIVQSATFVEGEIRICRHLRNVSTGPIVIRTLAPEGESSGVFNMAFYDARGVWIPPDRPFGFIPSPPPSPPPPRSADDISIYTILAPGEHAENCDQYDLPPGHRFFQAVTSFSPDVDLDLVPDQLKRGRVIIGRGLEGLRSAPCRIDTERRSADCDPPAR